MLILALKLLLLAFDPVPKLFMGDSGSYIWTALTGWIPTDRSYFYGYVIRYSAVWTESLTGLLLLQMCASAITALCVARICHSTLGLSARVSYVFGVLCAVDPLQLVWERYVLTETLSLLLYALVLERSLAYLRHRRIRDILIIQVIAVLLIGFRMSYLLVVQVSAVLLPLIAFLPELLARLRKHSVNFPPRFVLLRQATGHCLVSVIAMVGLHTGYKQANGLLSEREPGYLYSSGIFLLAIWAPALEPADAPDPRLAELIAKGDEFQIKDLALRNAQVFMPGFLVPRWLELEPDPVKAGEVAKATAMHALTRNPWAIMTLAGQTFSGYWDKPSIKHYAEIDLGHVDLTAEQVTLLAEKFHADFPQEIVNIKSPLKKYFLKSWRYSLLVLLAPLWSGILVFVFAEKKYVFLLFVHNSILVGTTLLFAVAPSIRYLQPVSFLTLIVMAGYVRVAMDYRRKRA